MRGWRRYPLHLRSSIYVERDGEEIEAEVEGIVQGADPSVGIFREEIVDLQPVDSEIDLTEDEMERAEQAIQEKYNDGPDYEP